jgi:soluble lytic murein transglycosylase-like protein
MDALRAFSLSALLTSAPQTAQNCAPVEHVSSPLIDRWQSDITKASRRFDIPEDWIRAVMKQESAGLTTLDGQPMTSHVGAMGLMQLMPGTWSDMQARYGMGNNPFDPSDNILAGTAYLREMYDRYGYPNLFAAYHAGPGHVDAFIGGLKPLPDATLTYLESIVPGVEISQFLIRNPVSKATKSSPNSLFFMRLEGKISFPQSSNSDSKSVKSKSKIGETRRENAPGQIVESVYGESDLFVPLTQPAR